MTWDDSEVKHYFLSDTTQHFLLCCWFKLKVFVSAKSWRHIDVLPRLNWSPNLFCVPEAALGRRRQPALTLDKCARIFLFRIFSLSRNHSLSLQDCIIFLIQHKQYPDNSFLNWFSNTVSLSVLSAPMSKSSLWDLRCLQRYHCLDSWAQLFSVFKIFVRSGEPLTPFSPHDNV